MGAVLRGCYRILNQKSISPRFWIQIRFSGGNDIELKISRD
jgi:hypothetical protein